MTYVANEAINVIFSGETKGRAGWSTAHPQKILPNPNIFRNKLKTSKNFKLLKNNRKSASVDVEIFE